METSAAGAGTTAGAGEAAEQESCDSTETAGASGENDGAYFRLVDYSGRPPNARETLSMLRLSLRVYPVSNSLHSRPGLIVYLLFKSNI